MLRKRAKGRTIRLMPASARQTLAHELRETLPDLLPGPRPYSGAGMKHMQLPMGFWWMQMQRSQAGSPGGRQSRST